MSDQKRITRSFWAVVTVGFTVLGLLYLGVRASTNSTAKRFCLVDRDILLRQRAGARNGRDTDRFFRDNSTNPAFRSHFGGLVPIQTGRIIEINAELHALRDC